MALPPIPPIPPGTRIVVGGAGPSAEHEITPAPLDPPEFYHRAAFTSAPALPSLPGSHTGPQPLTDRSLYWVREGSTPAHLDTPRVPPPLSPPAGGGRPLATRRVALSHGAAASMPLLPVMEDSAQPPIPAGASARPGGGFVASPGRAGHPPIPAGASARPGGGFVASPGGAVRASRAPSGGRGR